MPENFKEIVGHTGRIFVVGDLHGCLEELQAMVGFLQKERSLSAQDLLVFIGDYIDRGQESKGVIDALLALQRTYPEAVFLKGNHEDMLLNYLGYEGTMGEAYLANGGSETLRSYGINAFSAPPDVLAQFPKDHLSFLLNLERYLILDKFVCVHAGLNPLRDLRGQIDYELFWIRDEFIMNVHHFDKVVVFGHTPYRDVMFNLPFKIGIDTGAVYGNKLTCVELTKGEIFTLDVGETEIVVREFPTVESQET